MPSSSALRAAWVFPVDRPPIRDGVVEILDGRIHNVRSYQPGETVRDLGDVALLPGLVNAHMHLEFSSLLAPLGTGEETFPDWIRHVLKYRREETERDANWQSVSIARGLSETASSGVVAAGEIASPGCRLETYSGSTTECTVFLELLGLAEDRWEALQQAALAHVAMTNYDGVRRGLSPHASYTVHVDFLAWVCRLSKEVRCPVAFHLAESMEEIELLQSGGGRMAELLKSLSALPAGAIRRGTRTREYLEILAEADRSLVIHGNFLSADEIAYLGERGERMSVAYCPRTHARFCAGRWPLVEMLAANVNVCLGTDSRATNPDLHLFEEMRFIAERYPEVSAEGVLYLGTSAGALALGRESELGSITPGKLARLAILPLPRLTADDPHELLFEGTGLPTLVDQSLPPPLAGEGGDVVAG